jgi:hypothetical protein
MLTTYNLSFSKGKIHVDIFDAFTGVRIAGGIWSDADAMLALAFLKDHQDELTFMPRVTPELPEDQDFDYYRVHGLETLERSM